MIKNIETTNKKSFKKYYFILAFSVLVLLIIAYSKNYSIFKLLNRNVDVDRYQQTILADDKSAQQLNISNENNNYKVVQDQIDQYSNDEEGKLSQSSGEQIEKKYIEPVSQQSDDLNLSDEYLTYLKNVNQLITNFCLDQPYTDYLNQIKNVELSENLGLLLKNLEDYNNDYLISPPQFQQLVFPIKYEILQKFIRITKNFDEKANKLDKKNNIIKQLKFWIDYCYTEDFKVKFNKRKK